MKNVPYIGVTGFINNDEIMRCLSVVPRDAERKFMAGVLLSSKTINGGTNKYPVRYPHYKSIKSIFSDDSRCLNLIHYVTDDKNTLVKQLLDAAEIGGANCHGFQLNVVWPNIDMLVEVKKELPNHKFVIQCGGTAMKKFTEVSEDEAPVLMHSLIEKYRQAGVIDYLLIDPSGGRGKSFDAKQTIKMLKPHAHQTDYGIGVAGGLHEKTIMNLVPVLNKLPYLFWDAEGGLRDSEDNLSINAAIEYLRSSYYLDYLLNAKEKFENENSNS